MMRRPVAVATAKHSNSAPKSTKKKTPSLLRVTTGVVVSKPAQNKPTRIVKPNPTHPEERAGQPGVPSPSTAASRASSSSQHKPPPTSSSTSDTPVVQQQATSAISSSAAEQLKAIASTPTVDLPVLPLTWAEFQKATSTAPPPSAKAKRQGSSAGQPPAAAASSSGFGFLGQSSALLVFRYAVERDQLEKALQDAGLQDDVAVVEDIGLADVVVAVKATNSGKHVNIGQGQRTATNAGIPFIVLGRKVSAEGISAALRPLLLKKAAGASKSREQ